MVSHRFCFCFCFFFFWPEPESESESTDASASESVAIGESHQSSHPRSRGSDDDDDDDDEEEEAATKWFGCVSINEATNGSRRKSMISRRSDSERRSLVFEDMDPAPHIASVFAVLGRDRDT